MADVYPLFLHSVPVEDLPDDELCMFSDGLAEATRRAVEDRRAPGFVDAWLRHWSRTEQERLKRGIPGPRLFATVN